MYHNINDLCKKINVIKEKADKLQHLHNTTSLDTGFAGDPEVQFQLDDIQALCADIANDKENY